MSTTPHPSIGTVPLIDLGRWRDGDEQDRREIEHRVDAALTEVGFLIVTDHGIPSELIDEVRRTAGEAFALSRETKLTYRQRDGVGGPGWMPIGAEANAYASGQESAPDLKETWTVGPLAPDAVVPTSHGVVPVANLLPAEVPDFEPAMTRYLEAGLELTAELFELLSLAAGAPADTFGRLCTNPLHNLNLTWYPPLVDGDEVIEPEPDQFRIGPHSDFGTITVLHREHAEPPLQVQLPDGTWEDLPHVPDAFIVNTGDQLAHWSGGRWRSNPHRIPAPTGAAARRGQLSLVLFVETDLGAMLHPIDRPDGEPMDAVAYLVDKLVAIDTAI